MGHPKLNVLSKPEGGVINGKNRHRFPDPSQDKHVLLGIFDTEETLIKLNYIDENGIYMDERLEKEIIKDPLGVHYFVKLEQIQIDRPNGETDIKTEYFSKSLICAKLSDHTVVDNCVPKEVAGYWVRSFGGKCSFTLNFTLWSAEVNKKSSGKSYFTSRNCTINEEFYNLQKLDEIHVQFSNKQRKHTKSKPLLSKTPGVEKSAIDKPELLSIIRVLRSFRDNGKSEEFEIKCDEMLKSAKSKRNFDEELVIILEQSMFFCYQGSLSEGKRLLQKAVHLASKSSFSDSVKNHAYLFLAAIHVSDGNYGTAQECLGMIGKKSAKNMSKDGLVHKSLLHGIIMLHFGQKISYMSQNLWQEAGDDFEHAIEMSLKCKHQNGDNACLAHIWLAKLYIEMLRVLCKPGCKMPELDSKIMEQIATFEKMQFGISLSDRVVILGLLVKAEYCQLQEKDEEALLIIKNVRQKISINSRLYFQETKILRKLEEIGEAGKNETVDSDILMMTKTRRFLAKSDSESGYTADDSSSDEKIDLGDVKYKKTTYV